MKNIKFLFFIYAISLISCNSNPEKQALLQAKAVYHISDMSYLIAVNNQLAATHYATSLPPDTALYAYIYQQFSLPAELNRLMTNHQIKADSTLYSLFPAIQSHQLKIKDLVCVPASQDEFKLFTENNIQQMIRTILHSSPVSGTSDVEALFNHLYQLDKTFDTEGNIYLPPNDGIPQVFPGWYTRNLLSFFGWRIFKYEKQTILWQCFVNSKTTVLLLKFMDQHIFIATTYPTGKLPSPFDNNTNDLLRSPIALSVMQQLLRPNPLFHLKDLLNHAAFAERNGDSTQAKTYYTNYRTATGDSILSRYANQPAIAATGYIPDNINVFIPFQLDSTTHLQVIGGGQVMATDDYNNAPYQYDNIQFFIHSCAGKPGGDKKDTRVYHFNYRFNKIGGVRDDRLPDSWMKQTRIRYGWDDPTDTTYVLEAAIPWEELPGAQLPPSGLLCANIFIGDSDWNENQRESILSWATKPGQNWEDPATFGTLSFRKPGNGIYSPYTTQPPLVDGKPDTVWQNAAFSAINQPYSNQVSSRDISARFKTLHDHHYLYLLVEVTDNCKNKTGFITKDKCWIEDASTRELVWKLNADSAGPTPWFIREQRISLPAGQYILRYLSDKGYSNEGWYGKPPVNNIYGAALYSISK